MEKIENINLTIPVNVVYAKNKIIYPPYASKHTSKREKQIILLKIPKGERWDYSAVGKLSALLRGILSKHDDDFYCLNCLRMFRTKNKLESRKKSM